MPFYGDGQRQGIGRDKIEQDQSGSKWTSHTRAERLVGGRGGAERGGDIITRHVTREGHVTSSDRVSPISDRRDVSSGARRRPRRPGPDVCRQAWRPSGHLPLDYVACLAGYDTNYALIQ